MFFSVSIHIRGCMQGLVAVMFLMTWTSSMIAQEEWTSQQFLEYGLGELRLPFEENINFIDRAEGMPFINQYEFRTETDEMELEQQQFQFRFQFNSRDERKAFDNIMLANKHRYQWMQARYELDIWEARYDNLIDLYFYQKEMEILNQDLALLEDKKRVLTKILESEKLLDVNEWMANEAEIFETRTDSLELELSKKEIGQKLFGTERTIPNLYSGDMIPIAAMQEVLDGIRTDERSHPDDGLARAEEQLADAEYKLELAEANKWLKFAQIQYQSDNKLSFQREVSLSTSIVIPGKNNNRARKNEAALDLMEKSYETYLEKKENEVALLSDEAKMKDLVRQLEAFKELRRNQQLEGTYQSFAEERLVSPLVLIGIKRAILKNTKKQLSLEKDIYELYIDILTRNAAFLKEPRQNYLKIE